MSVLSQGIDYLSIAGYVDTVKELEKFLKQVAKQLTVRDEFYLRPGEGRVIGQKYRSSFYSVKGMYGGFTPQDDAVKFTLQLQGGFCRELTDPLRTLKLVSRFKFTRVDFAIDDYQRRISQKQIAKLGELGHYKGLDSFRHIGSKGSQDDEDIQTCYFGKALKKVRFYNAEFLHGIPADRWELELRGEYAETACREIIRERSLNNLGQYLTGTIDFIEPGETWRHNRRYQFWQNLIDEFNTAKLRSPEKKHSLAKTIAWLDRQVACSMTVLFKGYGEETFMQFCKELAQLKEDKLEPRHLAWITYLQRSKEEILKI